jgi:hypothetical protein
MDQSLQRLSGRPTCNHSHRDVYSGDRHDQHQGRGRPEKRATRCTHSTARSKSPDQAASPGRRWFRRRHHLCFPRSLGQKNCPVVKRHLVRLWRRSANARCHRQRQSGVCPPQLLLCSVADSSALPGVSRVDRRYLHQSTGPRGENYPSHDDVRDIFQRGASPSMYRTIGNA